jgi:MoaA/NifB/PqqE/SkfB family radical SAM enzyme
MRKINRNREKKNMSEIIRGLKALLTGRYRFGQLWNYYKAHHAPVGLDVNFAPPRLGIYVTGKCNMKCDFCLTHSEKIPDNPFKYQGSNDMSVDTFKDILNRYPNTLIVSFIGNGEPILNKDIFEMTDFAHKRKMGTTLFSNGLTLDKVIDKIVKSHIAVFNISVNAINGAEYERFTGYKEPVFKKIVENTKLLSAALKKANHPMKITATMLVDKQNYKDMEEMIYFAEEIGIHEVSLSHFMPWCSDGMTPEERSIYKDHKEAMDLIEELSAKRYGIAVTFPTIFDGEKDNRLCRDNVYSMSIDGDGNVSGCERKMLNTSLNGKYFDKDAFNNRHFKFLRKIFIKKEGKLPDPCVTCFNNTTCETKSIPSASGNEQKSTRIAIKTVPGKISA